MNSSVGRGDERRRLLESWCAERSVTDIVETLQTSGSPGRAGAQHPGSDAGRAHVAKRDAGQAAGRAGRRNPCSWLGGEDVRHARSHRSGPDAGSTHGRNPHLAPRLRCNAPPISEGSEGDRLNHGASGQSATIGLFRRRLPSRNDMMASLYEPGPDASRSAPHRAKSLVWNWELPTPYSWCGCTVLLHHGRQALLLSEHQSCEVTRCPVRFALPHRPHGGFQAVISSRPFCPHRSARAADSFVGPTGHMGSRPPANNDNPAGFQLAA